MRSLQALGLSEYAARTLVALTRTGGGSAREVSDTSSVPRTRVYDAVEELADRGFVRVRESHPKVFMPASPQQIRRAFFREYVYRLVVAELGLRSIRPADDEARRSDPSVEVGAAVDERFLAAITDAETTVTYVSVGETPSTDVARALGDAADRGVTVTVLLVGELDADAVGDAVPDARVLTVRNTATPPDDRSRFLLADDATAAFGTRTVGSGDPTVVGLFSERSGSDVAMLLQYVIDTWLADAGSFDTPAGDDDR